MASAVDEAGPVPAERMHVVHWGVGGDSVFLVVWKEAVGAAPVSLNMTIGEIFGSLLVDVR